MLNLIEFATGPHFVYQDHHMLNLIEFATGPSFRTRITTCCCSLSQAHPLPIKAGWGRAGGAGADYVPRWYAKPEPTPASYYTTP